MRRQPLAEGAQQGEGLPRRVATEHDGYTLTSAQEEHAALYGMLLRPVREAISQIQRQDAVQDYVAGASEPKFIILRYRGAAAAQDDVRVISSTLTV